MSLNISVENQISWRSPDKGSTFRIRRRKDELWDLYAGPRRMTHDPIGFFSLWSHALLNEGCEDWQTFLADTVQRTWGYPVSSENLLPFTGLKCLPVFGELWMKNRLWVPPSWTDVCRKSDLKALTWKIFHTKGRTTTKALGNWINQHASNLPWQPLWILSLVPPEWNLPLDSRRQMAFSSYPQTRADPEDCRPCREKQIKGLFSLLPESSRKSFVQGLCRENDPHNLLVLPHEKMPGFVFGDYRIFSGAVSKILTADVCPLPGQEYAPRTWNPSPLQPVKSPMELLELGMQFDNCALSYDRIITEHDDFILAAIHGREPLMISALRGEIQEIRGRINRTVSITEFLRLGGFWSHLPTNLDRQKALKIWLGKFLALGSAANRKTWMNRKGKSLKKLRVKVLGLRDKLLEELKVILSKESDALVGVQLFSVMLKRTALWPPVFKGVILLEFFQLLEDFFAYFQFPVPLGFTSEIQGAKSVVYGTPPLVTQDPYGPRWKSEYLKDQDHFLSEDNPGVFPLQEDGLPHGFIPGIFLGIYRLIRYEPSYQKEEKLRQKLGTLLKFMRKAGRQLERWQAWTPHHLMVLDARIQERLLGDKLLFFCGEKDISSVVDQEIAAYLRLLRNKAPHLAGIRAMDIKSHLEWRKSWGGGDASEQFIKTLDRIIMEEP